MPTLKPCARCGTELRQQDAGGLCVRCCLESGLDPRLDPQKNSTAIAPPAGGEEALRTIGDYELLAEIGRGGMGVVYRARQVSLDRIVAVKMLLHGEFSNEAFVWRFKTEAAAAAQLDHPHIVPIYEIGEQDGLHYFSMKLFAKGSLYQQLQDTAAAPFPPTRAAQLLATIARAVHYAHQRGVIHRDLKPQNILLDAEGCPHLTDFGLAKLLERDAELTLTDAVMGSPAYMAPEQAAGRARHLTTSADIYSLGAILYVLLTRRPPFQAETPVATLRQVIESEPVSPSAIRPTLPSDLVTVCLKCLEKDPARRYVSAEALANDLHRFLHREPISARPAAPWDRGHKWVRRNPLLAALGVATILLLLAILLGTPVALYRIVRERHHAEENLYFADLHGAETALEDGDLRRARELVAAHRLERGKLDGADFAWRLLWTGCRGDDLYALRGHSNSLNALKLSPHAPLLLSHSADNYLKAWDLGTRTARFTITNATTLGGFSPDGQSFAYGTTEGSVNLAEVLTGRTVYSLPEAGELVALLADGKTVATTSKAFIVKFWDIETGAESSVLPVLPGRGGIDLFGREFGPGVVITPDGTRLAISNGFRQGITLWNLATRQIVNGALDRRGESPITFMELSPDGTVLAVGGFDGLVRFWDTATSAELLPPLQTHLEPVFSLAWSRDGRQFATASVDQSIKLWDFSNRRQIDSFFGHEAGVWAIAYSGDGQQLASGSQDQTVRLWSVNQQPNPRAIAGLAKFAPEQPLLPPLAWSPDSKTFAAGLTNGTVGLWDSSTLQLRRILPQASRALGFSADGRNLTTCSTNGQAVRWDPGTGEMTQHGFPVPPETWSSLAIFPDRNHAVLTSLPGGVQLWDFTTGKLDSMPAHSWTPCSVAVSADGEAMVSGGFDGTIDFWDLSRRRCTTSIVAHAARVMSLAISPDGAVVASGSTDNSIKLWELKSGRFLRALNGHKRAVWTLAFSPDGKTLASGSGDYTVRLWDVSHWRELVVLRNFAGNTPAVNAEVRLVSFSPDGNTLAAATGGGLLKLFHAATAPEIASHARGDLFFP